MDELLSVDEYSINESIEVDYNRVGNTFKYNLAREAFSNIANYDNNINAYFNKDMINLTVRETRKLKYGMNPNNESAAICSINGENMPFSVLSGKIGYINTLDAVGSWRLVNEVKTVLDKDCCASFKHTIPTGVAVCVDKTIRNESIADVYKRARNVDPLSSFGDFIACSGHVDEKSAEYISK